MSEGPSSDNQNPASNSAGGSESGATASNSGSGQRTLLSGIIEKLEQTYGLMGAREDLGGRGLAQVLGFGVNVDMQQESETDTVDQGRDAAGGSNTATDGSESAGPRMFNYIVTLRSDKPFLNQPQLVGSGGNVSDLKQDGAYLYFLKSGLENMGIHPLITRSGMSLVTTAIEDGRVTPAARFLARLSQTVGTGEADLIVIHQNTNDDGRQGE